MDELSRTDRTTLRRLPNRGVYDRASIHSILDEGLICHVAFVVDGQPYVIPTIHVRVGEQLFFHGSPASRMLRALERGVEVCVTVTLPDGLVLARSAFHQIEPAGSLWASAHEVRRGGNPARGVAPKGLQPVQLCRRNGVSQRVMIIVNNSGNWLEAPVRWGCWNRLWSGRTTAWEGTGPL